MSSRGEGGKEGFPCKRSYAGWHPNCGLLQVGKGWRAKGGRWRALILAAGTGRCWHSCLDNKLKGQAKEAVPRELAKVADLITPPGTKPMKVLPAANAPTALLNHGEKSWP